MSPGSSQQHQSQPSHGYSPSAMSGFSSSPYMQGGSAMALDEPPSFQPLPPSGPYDYNPSGSSSQYGHRPARMNPSSSSSDPSLSPGANMNMPGGIGLPSINIPAKRERNSSGSSGGGGEPMAMTGIEGHHSSHSKSPMGSVSASPLITPPASVPGPSHVVPPGMVTGPRQVLQNRSRSQQQLNSHQIRGPGNNLQLQPSTLPVGSLGTSSAPGSATPDYNGFGRNVGSGRQPNKPPSPQQRTGLRRVSDPVKDLKPIVGSDATDRRADPDVPGAYLSVSFRVRSFVFFFMLKEDDTDITFPMQPLKCLTTQLAQTYSICDPNFRYEATHNPRRVLTKPSQPAHNNGSDNQDYDYILYVNDVLTADNGTGDKYLILDVLGQGTFGQVAKCQNMRTHEIVAVKVVKNKPAYFNQSTMEVAILQLVSDSHAAHTNSFQLV